MRPASLILAILPALLPGAALSQEPTRVPCRSDDKDCAAAAMRGHVITKADYWKRALGRPLEQRMGAAPPEVVEYLTLDNIKSGFPEKPRPAQLRGEFLRDARAAIAELPRGVRSAVSGKLAGIHFVEDLGGTGYTEEIYDARSNPVGGFIVLDMSVLGRTANAWATWKENTPFQPQPGYQLTAVIERRAGDTRKNAIQYILLHELGHIAAIGGKIHPSWNVEPKDVASPADYPYFALSWRISRDDNRYLTKFDDDFPQRRDVVYYVGARLAAAQMVDTYDRLGRTNFATLYSVTGPGDDFAEAFASYVHSVMMKKPFEIRIHRNGRIVKVYGSCWSEPRCAEKKAILQSLLR